MTETTTAPRVYVADLGAYVAGYLRGEWFTPTDYDDAGAFADAVQDYVVKRPGAEEWAIHDYDGYGSIRLGEYESLETVWTHAQAIGEHGDAWADYVSNVGTEYATAEGFADSYCGQYDSGADYAQESWEDCADPETVKVAESWPFTCIDWSHAWRELTFDGYWISDSGNVFRPV